MSEVVCAFACVPHIRGTFRALTANCVLSLCTYATGSTKKQRNERVWDDERKGNIYLILLHEDHAAQGS